MTRRKNQPVQVQPANDHGIDDGAFPEAEAEVEPAIDLMTALVSSLTPALDAAAPPTASAPKPRAVPRRVSAEVVKAETKLLSLERRRQESFAHAETVWAAKRVALIRSFPADVLAALEAMNVLAGDELEAIEGLEVAGD